MKTLPVLATLLGVVAWTFAAAPAASAAPKPCPTKGNECTIELKLVNGRPAVVDDPIVLQERKHGVHINWRAPRGWEFMDGGVSLKSSLAGAGAGEFDQWCATDTDNDECRTRNARGRQYHCRAHNRTPGAHRYQLRLRKIGTGIEHVIDPTIINKGS